MKIKGIRYPQHAGQLRAATLTTETGRRATLPKTLREGAFADRPHTNYGLGQSHQDVVRKARRQQRTAKKTITDEATWIKWQEKARKRMAHRDFWAAIV